MLLSDSALVRKLLGHIHGGTIFVEARQYPVIDLTWPTE